MTRKASVGRKRRRFPFCKFDEDTDDASFDEWYDELDERDAKAGHHVDWEEDYADSDDPDPDL